MNEQNPKKRHKTLGWSGSILVLAVLIAALAVSGSLAAYTSLNSVKRVVSTTAGAGTMFSSNYMSLTDTDSTAYTTKTFSFNDTEENPAFTVTVCNYAQSSPKYTNDDTITYTLTATLVNKDGTAYTGLTEEELSKYTLTVGGKTTVFANGAATLTDQTLTGGEKSKNSYTITMDPQYMETVYVLVTAVPDTDSLSATDQRMLACKFRGTTTTNQRSNGWSGSFTDAQVTSDPSQLDGFNYEVSGYGEGEITLTWDTTKVAISPWFLADQNVQAAYNKDDHTGSVTFTVTAEDTSFSIQFYRVTAAETDETPAAVQEYVAFSFTAAAANTSADTDT